MTRLLLVTSLTDLFFIGFDETSFEKGKKTLNRSTNNFKIR